MDHGEIGAKLRWLRELTGLRARELDRLAGRTEGHVALIEARPTAKMNADTAADYAAVFGVSLDWLIRGEGPEPTAEDVLAAVERARARRSA